MRNLNNQIDQMTEATRTGVLVDAALTPQESGQNEAEPDGAKALDAVGEADEGPKQNFRTWWMTC